MRKQPVFKTENRCNTNPPRLGVGTYFTNVISHDINLVEAWGWFHNFDLKFRVQQNSLKPWLKEEGLAVA